MPGVTKGTMDARGVTQSKGTPEDLLGHGDVLLRYALTRVPDKETAEDLVQETFVTAVDGFAGFKGTSTMRTWLIGILRHKILDYYRWKQRHPGNRPDHDGEHVDDSDPWFTPLGAWRMDPNVGLEALDGDPALEFERSQLRAVLRFCIDHLPASLHRVFVLRELEDMEPDAACEAAGISRGSLAVFLYRARQTLRACLQKRWVEP